MNEWDFKLLTEQKVIKEGEETLESGVVLISCNAVYCTII